jgi:hypothetical protein
MFKEEKWNGNSTKPKDGKSLEGDLW